MNSPIPEITHYAWDAIYRCCIVADDEALLDTNAIGHAKIKTQSDYFRQGIQHALPSCYVRRSVAEKLADAAEKLPDNVNLLIWDGWRPLALQEELVQRIALAIEQKFPHESPEQQKELLSRFVAMPSAKPTRPSPHLTGGSVDLTLCDDAGVPLNMGTGFDEPSPASWTHGMELPDADTEARDNRRMLYWAMLDAGFTNLPSEWWHFDYGNQLWCYFGRHNHAFYSATHL